MATMFFSFVRGRSEAARTRRRAGRSYLFLGLLASAALAGIGAVIPAGAAQQDLGHVVNLAGKQRMLTQKMAKEALLVALGVRAEDNLRNLGSSRTLFDMTLTGLRHGDDSLDLPRTSHPAILERLDRVDQIWAEMDRSLQPILSTGKLSSSEVAVLAALNVPLMKAMNDAVLGFENSARDGMLFSTTTMAINLSERQRMLSQKMAKEFFLVAYGYDTKRNRKDLAESIALFDKTLTGLIFGDSASRLSPAPTPAIAAQLTVVQQVWSRFAAVLRPVADNKEVVPETVIPVAQLNMELLSEMDQVVEMFEAL